MPQHSENTTDHPQRTVDPILGETLVELGGLGRAWADNGLRIGAAALQTSALTLAQTANMLVNLATSLSPDRSA